MFISLSHPLCVPPSCAPFLCMHLYQGLVLLRHVLYNDVVVVKLQVFRLEVDFVLPLSQKQEEQEEQEKQEEEPPPKSIRRESARWLKIDT